MIAALGDLDVGKMIRCQPEARRVIIRDIVRLAFDVISGRFRFLLRGFTYQFLNDLGNLGQLIQADKRVHFRNQTRQLLGKTLRHAAGDDEFLAAVAFAQSPVAVCFKNGVYAFLVGRIDERTGVYNEHVRLARFRGHFHAGLVHVADHDFRIDQVLGAAQRYKADFGGLFIGVRHVFQKASPACVRRKVSQAGSKSGLGMFQA